ncbi:MAG: SpoIIE family protein phosphatase [Spirochaetes bacterium]|nr:SpoIIE family protein phosphatase [Spirochaetota bacterium]
MKPIAVTLILFLIAITLTGCGPHVEEVQLLEGVWQLTTTDTDDNAHIINDDGISVTLPCVITLPAILKDENSPRTITLPESGYVWIQKEFVMDTIPTNIVALQIGEVMNADITYCNGIVIGRCGRFPPHFKSAWNQFRHYTIPGDVLKKGKNLISIRIYYDAEFWIHAPIRLVGDSSGKALYDYINFMRIHLMQALFFIMLTLAILFLVMFYYQRDSLEYLFFGLSCITVAFPQLLHFFENLYPNLTYSSNTVLKVSQPGLLFFPAFLNLFYRHHVGRNKKWITIIYIIIPVVLTCALIFQNSRSNILFIRNISLIVSLLFMIDLFIASGLQLLQRKKAGLLIFVGIAPMVLLGLHDVLAFGFKIIPSNIVLYVYGLPFLLFIIAIYLVNIFITALRQSKQLNFQLQQLLEDIKRLAFLEKELEIARAIQSQLLPSTIPDIKGLDIAVKFQPALRIGGDIYNIFKLKDGVIIFCADVVGHGIPAAMIASMINILFKMFHMLSVDPGLLLKSLNVNICNMLPQTFVTAACLYINRYEKFIRLARAGHPSVIIQKNDGNVKEYVPKGKALGLKTDNTFETINISVSPGDRVFIYTDGIIEAINCNKEMFGIERLISVITATNIYPSKEAIEKIYSELIQFIGDASFLEDDVTLIMIEIQ